jgi:adenylate cyclase
MSKPGPTRGKNIEVKARCHSLKRAAAAAAAIGARRAGVLHHTDTYFVAPHGRLKLREIRYGRSRSRAELIAYQRADRAGARESDYVIVPVADPKRLKLALSSALGVRAVVSKRRELWMFRNVRVHFDRVDRLGDFLELEGVVGPRASEAVSGQRVRELCAALAIDARDEIALSYVDLMEGTEG